ncbi:MAG: DUF488 domain-containing protein [Gammaproteobacteria bacterium]
MSIKIKRIYDSPEDKDGKRILVDRLWPRGLSKEKARVDLWMKEIAPSDELRRWYDHAAQKWPEFQLKYFAELKANPEIVNTLLKYASEGAVTLVYSSKENRFNNAVALKEYLESAG